AAQFSGATAQALVLYGGAVAAFVAALYLAPRSRGLVLPIFPTRVSGAWLKLSLVAVRAVVGVVPMLSSRRYTIVETLPDAPRGQIYWHVAALWVVSLVAYVVAFAQGWPRLAWREIWQRRRAEVIAANLLIALGLAVRVFALDNYPHNFGGDE